MPQVLPGLLHCDVTRAVDSPAIPKFSRGAFHLFVWWRAESLRAQHHWTSGVAAGEIALGPGCDVQSRQFGHVRRRRWAASPRAGCGLRCRPAVPWPSRAAVSTPGCGVAVSRFSIPADAPHTPRRVRRLRSRSPGRAGSGKHPANLGPNSSRRAPADHTPRPVQPIQYANQQLPITSRQPPFPKRRHACYRYGRKENTATHY